MEAAESALLSPEEAVELAAKAAELAAKAAFEAHTEAQAAKAAAVPLDDNDKVAKLAEEAERAAAKVAKANAAADKAAQAAERAAKLENRWRISWNAGDICVSTIDHVLNNERGRINMGDKGIVIGPSNEKNRVTVMFGDGKFVNMLEKSQIVTKAAADKVFALGWSIGDICVSTVNHVLSGARGTINVGDEGRVIGPCTSVVPDADNRVFVNFGDKKNANVLAKDQIVTKAAYAARVAAGERAAVGEHCNPPRRRCTRARCTRSRRRCRRCRHCRWPLRTRWRLCRDRRPSFVGCLPSGKS